MNNSTRKATILVAYPIVETMEARGATIRTVHSITFLAANEEGIVWGEMMVSGAAERHFVQHVLLRFIEQYYEDDICPKLVATSLSVLMGFVETMPTLANRLSRGYHIDIDSIINMASQSSLYFNLPSFEGEPGVETIFETYLHIKALFEAIGDEPPVLKPWEQKLIGGKGSRIVYAPEDYLHV